MKKKTPLNDDEFRPRDVHETVKRIDLYRRRCIGLNDGVKSAENKWLFDFRENSTEVARRTR